MRSTYLLAVVLTLFAAASAAVDSGEVRIWPMPASVSRGGGRMFLSKEFRLSIDQESKYVDPQGILKDGFDRMLAAVTMSHAVAAGGAVDRSFLLQGIHIVISSPGDELQYGVDESYKLMVPSPNNQSYAHLEAKTIYGALHGLQTFSQLCSFDFTTRMNQIGMTPLNITDKPRFSYRGLLIDTSRHFLPLPVIKNVIDSMAYSKLNVLHWHIVDTESFPLEIPSYPKLWEGSYSKNERYTTNDAAEIVSYAQRRGIHVLAEIDIPGHALSWGVGYPYVWPSKDCKEPLDVSNESTFKLIDGILSDFSKIFKFRFVHLGGDEVNTTCWSATPHINKWLTERNMSESQAYEYFVLRAQKIALSHGYEIINWEETFNNFGSKLNPKTVVHNWLSSGVAERVTAAGLRCIVSNNDKWYLDHMDKSWQDFYTNEPLANITNGKQRSLVLGGEGCLWGEHIDASNIQLTLWPRAAAAAERLWTAYNKVGNDLEKVAARLAHFRCWLNQRGVAAAPLGSAPGAGPSNPGSCSNQ